MKSLSTVALSSPTPNISLKDNNQLVSTQVGINRSDLREITRLHVKRDKLEDSSFDSSGTDSDISFSKDRNKSIKLAQVSSVLTSPQSLEQNFCSNIDMNVSKNINIGNNYQNIQIDGQTSVQPKPPFKRQNFVSNKNRSGPNKDKNPSNVNKAIREPICIYFDKRFDNLIVSSPKLLQYVKQNTSAKVRSVMRDTKKALIFPETNEDIMELMRTDTNLFPGCFRRNIGLEK